MSGMISIDTDDSVFHKPSREWWSVAFVEDGRLCAVGWPLSFVPISECLLVTKASEKERGDMLLKLASMSGDDPRKRYALRRLEVVSDSPIAVRALIPYVAYLDKQGVAHWDVAGEMLARYADLIEESEKQTARIRELEAQLKTSMLSERDVLHAANERIQELESRGAPRAGWADEWQQLREYADGDDEKAMPREQLRQLLVSAELHMEDQSDYGAMLEQDIHELHDKIAAHEKVCAGVWVPCSERLPDWYDQVVVIDAERVMHMSALQTGAGEREPYWIDDDMMDDVTHWLDAKEPQR